ncbi:hypothetical protein ABZ478_35900 [Streptomyces sp. NPDC005706]|uniref:hypothetical protein n=1 Tax=Streptomyces sp. NPDC005706 TaxID=3157169 RepID=UPI0033DD373E
MHAHGHTICCPELSDPDRPTRPLLDFEAGYIKRAIDHLPRQGAKEPWLMSMEYQADVKLLREDSVEDENLRFSSPATAARTARGLQATAHLGR